MRLFFAINLPDKIKAELYKTNIGLINQLPAAKWVEKQNIHLTVKFLGNTNDDDLLQLIETSQNIVKGTGEFHVDLKNYDLFPPTNPRIIFITLASSELINFAKNFISEIDKLSFVKPEHRGFMPHITLARVKKQLEPEHFSMVRKLKYHSSFTVKQLDLMSSELSPKGPIYTLIDSFTLQ